MFKPYMHIERFGLDEVAGINVGTCYIFPKIDGTNASVWYNGKLHAGSRKRELTLEKDNAGFLDFVLSSPMEKRLLALFSDKPSWRLYGEWLVPHTLKTYREDAWKHFYVFDVFDDAREEYLPYYEYIEALQEYGVDFIPPIEIVDNPTEEHLVKLLSSNTFLIEDGKGSGEGIVVKRYGFKNNYGRTVWAKLVRNEFREKHINNFGLPRAQMSPLEHKLAQEFVTEARLNKVLAKMRETGPFSRKRIPELFGRVWHEIITEEMWNILKSYGNVTINFRFFYSSTIEEVKRLLPEIFDGR